jgi:hypothetical protein
VSIATSLRSNRSVMCIAIANSTHQRDNPLIKLCERKSIRTGPKTYRETTIPGTVDNETGGFMCLLRDQFSGSDENRRSSGLLYHASSYPFRIYDIF